MFLVCDTVNNPELGDQDAVCLVVLSGDFQEEEVTL